MLTAPDAEATETSGYGALPPQLVTWVANDLKGAPIAWASHTQETLPTTNQTVFVVKVGPKAQPGHLRLLAYDMNGVVLPDRGAALRRKEREAWYGLHGARTREMVEVLETAKPTDLVPVGIMLRVYLPRAIKEELVADPLKRSQHRAAVGATLKVAHQLLAASLPKALVDKLHPIVGTPALRARLTHGTQPRVACLA